MSGSVRDRIEITRVYGETYRYRLRRQPGNEFVGGADTLWGARNKARKFYEDRVQKPYLVDTIYPDTISPDNPSRVKRGTPRP